MRTLIVFAAILYLYTSDGYRWMQILFAKRDWLNSWSPLANIKEAVCKSIHPVGARCQTSQLQLVTIVCYETNNSLHNSPHEYNSFINSNPRGWKSFKGFFLTFYLAGAYFGWCIPFVACNCNHVGTYNQIEFCTKLFRNVWSVIWCNFQWYLLGQQATMGL